MDKMNFIYFVLGAVSLVIGLVIHPWVKRIYSRVKSMFKRKSRGVVPHYCDALSTRIDELEKSIKIREVGRKNKTKKIVLEYLKELQDEK
tara:strand:- start:261 stop:530 length:270 start_codon:yes stop_codon:yes gene_type:complete